MSAEFWADMGVWFTALEWNVIATLFFLDALRVDARARRIYATATRSGNGRVIIARYRRKISRWYLLGSGIAFSLGILRIFQLTIDPPPVTEFRIISILITQGIVVMLFAFWRSKRANLALHRVLDARRLEETGRS